MSASNLDTLLNHDGSNASMWQSATSPMNNTALSDQQANHHQQHSRDPFTSFLHTRPIPKSTKVTRPHVSEPLQSSSENPQNEYATQYETTTPNSINSLRFTSSDRQSSATTKLFGNDSVPNNSTTSFLSRFGRDTILASESPPAAFHGLSPPSTDEQYHSAFSADDISVKSHRQMHTSQLDQETSFQSSHHHRGSRSHGRHTKLSDGNRTIHHPSIYYQGTKHSILSNRNSSGKNSSCDIPPARDTNSQQYINGIMADENKPQTPSALSGSWQSGMTGSAGNKINKNTHNVQSSVVATVVPSTSIIMTSQSDQNEVNNDKLSKLHKGINSTATNTSVNATHISLGHHTSSSAVEVIDKKGTGGQLQTAWMPSFVKLVHSQHHDSKLASSEIFGTERARPISSTEKHDVPEKEQFANYQSFAKEDQLSCLQPHNNKEPVYSNEISKVVLSKISSEISSSQPPHSPNGSQPSNYENLHKTSAGFNSMVAFGVQPPSKATRDKYISSTSFNFDKERHPQASVGNTTSVSHHKTSEKANESIGNRTLLNLGSHSDSKFQEFDTDIGGVLQEEHRSNSNGWASVHVQQPVPIVPTINIKNASVEFGEACENEQVEEVGQRNPHRENKRPNDQCDKIIDLEDDANSAYDGDDDDYDRTRYFTEDRRPSDTAVEGRLRSRRAHFKEARHHSYEEQVLRRRIRDLYRNSRRSWSETNTPANAHVDGMQRRQQADRNAANTRCLAAVHARMKENPVVSFVSRQLHKYLLSVENEIEEATGTTKLGAVLFADASGFTAMTQRLARQPNGAEELSRIINSFFSRLLRIVRAFGGDVVKFSGDALSLVWFVDEEESKRTKGFVSPTLAVATKRACACAQELHQKLDKYEAIKASRTESSVCLRLHMGIGAGRLTAVHVGGIFKRWEYILSGPPMTQIAIAEPLAKPGETVMSPEACELAGRVIMRKTPLSELVEKRERTSVEVGQHGNYIRMEAVRHIDIPGECAYYLPVNDHVNELIRRYIPKAVLQCLDENQPPQSEMRNVSVIFVNIHGLKIEVEPPDGDPLSEIPQNLLDEVTTRAQTMMLEIQRNVYIWEGSINKLMVDDKGLLVLCAMGLPPMPHFDDPIRAIAAALDLRDNIKLLSDKFGTEVHATIGVSTGRAFCGVVGSNLRREYTIMGEIVNLAARLMCITTESKVIVDEASYRRCQDISRDRFSFNPTKSLKLKGMDLPITAYCVERSASAATVVETVISDISGRENERDRLADMVHKLVELHGGTLVLTGGRGSGKSQLVKDLQRQGKDRSMKVFHVTKAQEFGDSNLINRHIAREDGRYHVAKDQLPVVVFGAWQDVFRKLIAAVSPTTEEQIRWIHETINRASSYLPAVLLRHVLPSVYEPILQQHNSEENTELLLSLQEAVDAILQTGTALKVNVDPESWQLAMKLSNHCLHRRDDPGSVLPLVLCVVTRPITKVKDPVIKEIWCNGATDDSFLELGPLSEMARLRYAAQVLSKLSGKSVSQAALPPELVIFLDEGAAGIPKHIFETLRECMRKDALGEDGPAIRVSDNGRIECRDLHQVRIPDKIVAIVNQEFVQLSSSHQALLKAVCVHRSFTGAMAQEMIELAYNRDPNFEYRGNLSEDLNELVKLHVLKRIPKNVYTTSYFPTDLFSKKTQCYAFSSKVMQQEVSKLMLDRTYGHLRNEVSQRITSIVSAVAKIQNLFRRIRSKRKSARTDKEAMEAAYVIQNAFRKYLTRVRSRRRRESGSFHSLSVPSRRGSYGILCSQSEDDGFSPDVPCRPPANDFIAIIPDEDGEVKHVTVRRGIGRPLPPDPWL